MDSDQRITKEPTLVKEMLTILSYLVGKQVTISVSCRLGIVLREPLERIYMSVFTFKIGKSSNLNLH